MYYWAKNGQMFSGIKSFIGYRICVKLIKILRLNLGKKLVPNMQIRIHEVDFDKGTWNIYNN
ncbi:hypothetical protein [Aquimarina algicola]|uniref:Uncharacterized protein n=1 Tax=Aquimarina algicola TaxID=2589995 RepID=A0A504JLR5_9FLAO|nr:hypothetical protein [Aquimarina algicola]TPN87420.1 hypothetical protein FHK87_07510 [Aquimarina algicola]